MKVQRHLSQCHSEKLEVELEREKIIPVPEDRL